MQFRDQQHLGLFEAVVHCHEILNNDGMFESRVPIDLLLSEKAL